MRKIALITLTNLLLQSAGFFSPVLAQVDWKQEYADVCAKTDMALELPSDELKGYIDRCDALRIRIEELDGKTHATEKKVYLKRLKMCRDLYVFSLEYKSKE